MLGIACMQILAFAIMAISTSDAAADKLCNDVVKKSLFESVKTAFTNPFPLENIGTARVVVEDIESETAFFKHTKPMCTEQQKLAGFMFKVSVRMEKEGVIKGPCLQTEVLKKLKNDPVVKERKVAFIRSIGSVHVDIHYETEPSRISFSFNDYSDKFFADAAECPNIADDVRSALDVHFANGEYDSYYRQELKPVLFKCASEDEKKALDAVSEAISEKSITAMIQGSPTGKFVKPKGAIIKAQRDQFRVGCDAFGRVWSATTMVQKPIGIDVTFKVAGLAEYHKSLEKKLKKNTSPCDTIADNEYVVKYQFNLIAGVYGQLSDPVYAIARRRVINDFPVNPQLRECLEVLNTINLIPQLEAAMSTALHKILPKKAPGSGSPLPIDFCMVGVTQGDAFCNWLDQKGTYVCRDEDIADTPNAKFATIHEKMQSLMTCLHEKMGNDNVAKHLPPVFSLSRQPLAKCYNEKPGQRPLIGGDNYEAMMRYIMDTPLIRPAMTHDAKGDPLTYPELLTKLRPKNLTPKQLCDISKLHGYTYWTVYLLHKSIEFMRPPSTAEQPRDPQGWLWNQPETFSNTVAYALD